MVSSDCKLVLLTLLDHLNELPSEGPNKLFVDGEFDSNQTTFEKQSNNLEIGVLADSDTVGYSLLHVLRMIIDDNFELTECLREWFEEDYDTFVPIVSSNSVMERYFGKATIEQIINVLKDRETMYTTIFNQGDEIKVELQGYRNGKHYREVIKKTMAEIDIWDMERIRKYILHK